MLSGAKQLAVHPNYATDGDGDLAQCVNGRYKYYEQLRKEICTFASGLRLQEICSSEALSCKRVSSSSGRANPVSSVSRGVHCRWHCTGNCCKIVEYSG